MSISKMSMRILPSRSFGGNLLEPFEPFACHFQGVADVVEFLDGEERLDSVDEGWDEVSRVPAFGRGFGADDCVEFAADSLPLEVGAGDHDGIEIGLFGYEVPQSLEFDNGDGNLTVAKVEFPGELALAVLLEIPLRHRGVPAGVWGHQFHAAIMSQEPEEVKCFLGLTNGTLSFGLVVDGHLSRERGSGSLRFCRC